MYGTVLVYLILLTPAIGSIVGLRSKICCHLAWWKVSKRTVMRFGTWANLHDRRNVRVHRGRFDLVNMTGADSREFETFRDGYVCNPPCRQVAVCGQKKVYQALFQIRPMWG